MAVRQPLCCHSQNTDTIARPLVAGPFRAGCSGCAESAGYSTIANFLVPGKTVFNPCSASSGGICETRAKICPRTAVSSMDGSFWDPRAGFANAFFLAPAVYNAPEACGHSSWRRLFKGPQGVRGIAETAGCESRAHGGGCARPAWPRRLTALHLCTPLFWREFALRRRAR